MFISLNGKKIRKSWYVCGMVMVYCTWFQVMEMFTIYKMIKANYEVDYDSVKVINS